MRSLKPVKAKRSAKEQRLREVLLGLVAYYIEHGKPVGSNTLKDAGFESLSSATLRNYFAELEDSGFLHQLHASGGRIPSDAAYRLYAEDTLDAGKFPKLDERPLEGLRQSQTREITRYLQESAELLSDYSQMAVFLSAPRFDHDYIIDIKVVTLDQHRCLCVLITDFGIIQTAVLHSQQRLTSFSAKRLESYFLWRLTGLEKPENLEPSEEELALKFYNEVMVRYIVSYSNFTQEDVYRTGFSRLLEYPEFSDATVLASSLALFENVQGMRHLLRECSSHEQMKFWIGEDLSPYSDRRVDSAVIAVPYRIHTNTVGAIGVLGPTRIPYEKVFATLERFSQDISDTLTKSVYKYKIKYREPVDQTLYLPDDERLLLGRDTSILLEDQST